MRMANFHFLTDARNSIDRESVAFFSLIQTIDAHSHHINMVSFAGITFSDFGANWAGTSAKGRELVIEKQNFHAAKIQSFGLARSRSPYLVG